MAGHALEQIIKPSQVSTFFFSSFHSHIPTETYFYSDNHLSIFIIDFIQDLKREKKTQKDPLWLVRYAVCAQHKTQIIFFFFCCRLPLEFISAFQCVI